MAKRELGPASLAVAQAVRAGVAGIEGPVVVAVSGGADSLALAAATAWVARREPIRPVAIVVDHGLQPGSADVAARAAEQCRGLGLEARVVRVTVTEHGEGPEAAARAARYKALEQGEGPILLGHTLDDQAETVLLQLARGGGPRALTGMAPVAGRLHRPLLGLRRSATAAACAEWGLEPWRDPHNADPAYARVRVRQDLLPALEAGLGPGVAESLARTAAQLRDDVDCLDALAASGPVSEELDAATTAALHPALRRRAVLRWLRYHGSPATSDAVARVEDLLLHWRGQGPIDVPQGRVLRAGRQLRFVRAQ